MPKRSTRGGFYAVRTGRKTGVFETWADCEEQTKNFAKARFKKFATFEEAQFFAWGIVPPEVSNDASTSDLSFTDSETKKRPRSPEIENESGWNVVYSDGACKGNGQVGSVAGIGVWWGPDDPRNIAERCPGDQTNNRAELIAILRVLETTPISTKPLLIKSDSRYSIDCLKTWIFKWKKNGFRNAQGEAVKNAGIIRCTSIQLDIRAWCQQKVLLQYVKGHSGNVGNDGADAMANRGALLPAVKDRDWAALEMKLSDQFEKISVETSGIEPVPMEVQDTDDTVESTAVELPPKMRKTSPGSHEYKSHISMAVAASSPFEPSPYPTVTEAPLRTSSVRPSNLLSMSSVPQDEKRGAIAPSPAPCSVMPASARPPLESSATVSKSGPENIQNKKVPLNVIYAHPPFVPLKDEEVNIDDYADCILDDKALSNELSD